MARFCFVAYAQSGHLDFGGMSYVHTAQELIHRGHEVQWVLSRPWLLHQYARVCELLKGLRIAVEDIEDLHLTVNSHKKDLRRSTRAFSQYLKSEKYDCVVVDRLCVGAAFAAHGARIPWAAVGTDGREWSHKRLHSTLHRAVLPLPRESSKIRMLAGDQCREDFPKPSAKSDWATSPFLNLSFFPRTYFEDGKLKVIPAHSHFMGSGPAGEPLLRRKHLLITFGNSFDRTLRRKLVDIVRPFLHNRSIPTLVLTGDEKLTKSLHGVFDGLKHVTLKSWVPYDEAYQEAIVALGHGGTSHIWYGMREGTPLLAIPHIGDQMYGGYQLERLNIGRVVLPFVLPCLTSRLLRKLGKIGIRLDKSELLNKLNDVLTNEEVLGNSLRIGRMMRKGGGVKASASLLERLSREQACVSTCVEPACCC